ncbi:hypothetical protein RND81_13G098400 [Saponaria officinalis]|uniref:Reverse transcriptase Ty1/copia-type domain-containing protein n=1 Tax=Saponaria officinalis TaxID=3572 RepID=A0AAW1H298_SAPOF
MKRRQKGNACSWETRAQSRYSKKGKVLLQLTLGKSLELNNVLHVPDIRRNLISGTLLNKAGIKLTFGSDKLVLTENGNFLEKGFCNGGRFVLDIMNENVSTCAYIAKSSSMWHARLDSSGFGPIRESRDVEFFDHIFQMKLNEPSCSSDVFCSYNVAGTNDDLAEPRRSKRARIENSFGPDFITNFLSEYVNDEIVNAFILEEDPRTYKEAMQSVGSSFCLQVINSEIESIMSNHNWILTDIPRGCKPLSNKWVFKNKLKPDGNIDKFKARLVVCGNCQTKGLDYIDTYSPVTKDMGVADVILGIKITRTETGLCLSQSHYVEKILEKLNQFDCTHVRTPYDSSMHLSKNKGNSIGQEKYAKIIGSVMYLMNYTRPDIAYAVSRLSRYTHNSGPDHWKALIRLLRYLKGTMDWGLHYQKTPRVLEGFYDANWVSDNDENYSTSGYVFTLANAAVSCKSSKQTYSAKSTMESEFYTLKLIGQEAECLRNILADIQL